MEQMIRFLSEGIRDALQHINMEKVYELRLRAEKPLYVNYGGEYRMLGRCGFTDKLEKAYFVQQEEIDDAVFCAGDYSVYSVEEQLKSGFLTTPQGVRIGIAGRFVYEGGKAITVRDITSLCVRIPHDVDGIGLEVYEKCLLGEGHNSVLLMSLPGRGKTTALREICRILSRKTGKNLLICDERGELAFGRLGATCDLISFVDKKMAFEVGIRTLRPDFIVTDELSEEDVAAVKRAIFSGVSVLASAHVGDASNGKKVYGGLFDRYVLFAKDAIGRIDKIYDADWTEVK